MLGGGRGVSLCEVHLTGCRKGPLAPTWVDFAYHESRYIYFAYHDVYDVYHWILNHSSDIVHCVGWWFLSRQALCRPSCQWSSIPLCQPHEEVFFLAHQTPECQSKCPNIFCFECLSSPRRVKLGVFAQLQLQRAHKWYRPITRKARTGAERMMCNAKKISA